MELKNQIFERELTFQEKINLNKKKKRDIEVNTLFYLLETTLKNLEGAIEVYKSLRNKTEYWEEGAPFNYDFETWHKLRKVCGHITRYYNEIADIRMKIREKEDLREKKFSSSNSNRN